MSVRKYLAMDLEIAKEIPEGTTDWWQHAPLGISCAATWASDEPEVVLWSGRGENGHAPQMSEIEVADLVAYLAYAANQLGYTIVTHNGTSFDWRMLAIESNSLADCALLAMNSIDSMFHFFALRGHFIGLDKIAKGAGLPGKTEGMSGALAPQMWANGEYDKVLEYVAQDVRTTLDVALAVEQQGCVRWISNSGRPNRVPLTRWLTVAEAMMLPEPDQSWMTNPVKRSQFVEWMQHG